MSGNPFRTALIQKQASAAAAPASPNTFINDDSSAKLGRDSDDVLAEASAAFATPAPKTKKSVRIESPTETIPPHPVYHDADKNSSLRLSYGQYAGSQPPMSPAGFSDNFEDIVTDDIQSREEVEVRDTTTGARRNIGQLEAVSPHSGAPANPFSRTLATIEHTEKGSGELTGPKRAVERAPSESNRTTLDVEGFKNLLMKGISPTSPRASGPSPQTATAPNPIGASVYESSSTDTSSISRQSIFEPVQEPHPESPRTSFDMAASDDERVGLVGEREAKKEKKKPPPAPKHRHGKLVSSRTPQTVSFDSFAASEPTPSLSTMRNRTNSDLNKPLPPTPPIISPPAHIISQDSSQEFSSISDTKSVETASISDITPPPQKRVPPPVPLARRQSQLRSSAAVGNRSRSNSSLTMSSQHSIEFPILSPGNTSEPAISPSSKAPPPPPPTRRHGAALSIISTSSPNSSSTELSSAATPRRPTLTSPNPLSSRRTTLSSEPPSPSPGLSLSRTTSVTSPRNPLRSVSNESATSLPPVAMPPPPPPPRRRQSQRSSLDKERPSIPLPPTSPTESRRTSTEYKRSSFDGKRRTSIASESSLRYEYAKAAESDSVLVSPREVSEVINVDEGAVAKVADEPEGAVAAGSNSVLDEMERFQREIDELRERYKHAA